MRERAIKRAVKRAVVESLGSHTQRRRRRQELVPSALASSAGEMASSLGGCRFTGTLGSNFPAMFAARDGFELGPSEVLH